MVTAPSPDAAPAPPAPAETPAPFTPAQRVAFRFASVYLVLYIVPLPPVWSAIVPAFGRHVLGIAGPIADRSVGGGDALFNYIQLLLVFLVSAVASAVWSLRSKRLEYTKGYELLRVYVRYVLGSYMMMYGVSKLLPTQFTEPQPERLLTAYGASSPMGLLWTFMGYSAAYSMFTGLAEVLGAFLLFFRRTTTLGALLTVGIMANVVMMNLCYDVPVKIFSSHLLLMSAFLLLPDARRLVDFFVLGRPTSPPPPPPAFSPRLLKVARVLRPIYLSLITLALFGGTGWFLFTKGRFSPPPPLHGAYEVESFVRDGKVVAPSLDEPARWRHVAINRWSELTVFRMDQERESFGCENDAAKHVLTLSPEDAPPGDTSRDAQLSYSTTNQGHLVLRGRLSGQEIEATLRKMDESRFLLPSRGFHWVNETVFNR